MLLPPSIRSINLSWSATAFGFLICLRWTTTRKFCCLNSESNKTGVSPQSSTPPSHLKCPHTNVRSSAALWRRTMMKFPCSTHKQKHTCTMTLQKISGCIKNQKSTRAFWFISSSFISLGTRLCRLWTLPAARRSNRQDHFTTLWHGRGNFSLMWYHNVCGN